MDELVFSVRSSPVYRCDEDTCQQYPTCEVRIIGEPIGLGHAQVCRGHVEWAKAALTNRYKMLTGED